MSGISWQLTPGVLTSVASSYVAFPLVGRLTRLGWTLGGSPGIFGVPTCSALCARAAWACPAGALWSQLSGVITGQLAVH